MSQQILEKVGGMPAPWGVDTRKLLKGVQSHLPCTALAFGIIDAENPREDELLVVQGFAEPAVAKWVAAAANDKLVAAARAGGVAATRSGQRNNESSLHRSGPLLMCMSPEARTGRWWWLAAARDSKEGFSEAEQDVAMILLRRWQSRFVVPEEVSLGRLLIGSDNRLIAADLDTRELLLNEPALLPELITQLHQITNQRFPKLQDDDARDIAIQLGKRVFWVVFHRGRAVPGDNAHHWYVEIRPLDSDELVPVGTVPDDRVAASIAFLHDKFASAPSLAQTAKFVHMSPFHFHRLFSKQVGISPKHYLMRKQLQMAKWLLRAQRVPIGSIAASTGYSSHGHFTSTFHRLIGVSPTEYRESFY